MNSMRNRVLLIGHLGNDPEIVTLPNEKKLAKFSLATQDNYTNADEERVESAQWHRIIAWNKQADISEKFLKKGKEVAIDGKLNSRSYEDKDGVTKYVTEIVVNEIVFVGKQ